MLLHKLLENLDVKNAVEDIEIGGVTSDSRQIEAGMLFVCIRGGKFDGHAYAAQAQEAGAAAIVCEYDLGLSGQIIVPDSRYAYGIICGNWYGNPSRKLKMVGVTGTNGKTTIASMVKHILEFAGKRVGLLGTIQNEIDDIVLPAKHTTPDPLALHSMLDRMVKAGCGYAVMECSSHALDQHRLAGVRYEAAVFTNLTQDHLDYHENMENYYHAKKKLFSMCNFGIINADDAYGVRLAEEVPCKTYTFSARDDSADFTAHEVLSYQDGSKFMMVGDGRIARVNLKIPGDFSVSNAMAAGVCCLALGLDMEAVAAGLSSCPGVVGRIEVLDFGTPYTIIRDYAHSPDGLEKIITTMQKFAKGRVVTLFGCAGNRDRSKRKIMGEIVARYSDFVILTSDNPRDEDEMQIIEDAVPGLLEHPDTPHKIIADRYSAIEWALSNCEQNDVLILAGKGHEDYQVLAGETICFDEKKIVGELLARMQ